MKCCGDLLLGSERRAAWEIRSPPKRKARTRGGKEDKRGGGGGGSGGDKRRQKRREMALSAADAYVYLKQTIVGPKRICIIYINYLLIHIN